MEIIDILPFVIDNGGRIGIAEQGPFASSMWRMTTIPELQPSGTKFAWIAPDGGSYVDHKANFKRPTAEQVINGASPAILAEAVRQGLIEL